MTPLKLINLKWVLAFVSFACTLILLRCSTDPGSTAPIAGGAICTYENCSLRVVTNVVQSRTTASIYTVGHLFEGGEGGQLAQSLEDTLTVEYAPDFTFTIPGCTTTPTRVSYQVSASSNYFLAHHLFPSNCAMAFVTATMTGVLNKPGQAPRTLNGAGGSSETSGGGGSSLAHQTLFATSTRYLGNFGSISAADAHCVTVAAAGSQTSALAGTWKAVISDSVTSASAHITLHSGKPIKNTNGETLKSDASTLFSGSLSTAVTYDQDANLVAAPVSVWTGTTSTGAASGANCSDWTNGTFAFDGTSGDVSLSTEMWVQSNQGSCNASLHLYCINQ